MRGISTAPVALASATSSSYASLLNAVSETTGPAKAIYVQAGDRISIDVKSYYQTFSGSNNPIDVTDILAYLAGMFILNGGVAPPGMESSWASSTFTSNGSVLALLDDFFDPATSTDVLAYLGFIMVDEEFNLVESASGVIPVSAANTVETLAISNILIPKNGYIYIYVSNESPTDVYFDNLHIVHKKSTALELIDYYPFGLRNHVTSYTSLILSPENRLGYQQKEYESSLGYNMNQFGLRHYDPVLGRWHTPDPMMQFVNPYIAMANNPVSVIDPTGV